MGFGDTKPQPVQLLAARYVFHKLGGVSGRSKKKEKGSQMDAREAFAATTPLGKGVIQALADLLQQPVVGGGRGHGEGGAQECVLVALEALTLLVCDEGANRYSQGNSLHLVQEEAALKVISRAEALMNMRVLVGGVSLARVLGRGRRFSSIRDFRRRSCARLKVEDSKSPSGDTLSTVELSNTSQSLYNTGLD